MSFVPRSYQRRALREVARAYAAGKRRILLVSPTGSGKTCMGASIVTQFVSRRPDDPWFWVAHRRELVSQGVQTLERFGLTVGHSRLRATALGQAVSLGVSLARGEAPPGKLGIVDEAHHYAADVWGAFLAAYDPETLLVGLTATPERGDGRAMTMWDHLIVVAQTAELVQHWRDTAGEEGLVPCEVLRPARPQKPGFLARQPVDAYVNAGLQGKRAVVFAPSVPEADRMCADFIAHGIMAYTITDRLTVEDRDMRLASFAAGRVRVLVNVFILTEGWDCPEIDVVILARRFGSIGPMTQAVGRGRRPARGKEVCTILDLTGITHILGDPDEERKYSLTGVGIARKGIAGPTYCVVCGTIMPQDVMACPTCDRPRDVAEEMKSSGDPLEKFARFKRDDDETRARRLAKFTQQEIDAGHNPKRAFHRYKGMYGAMPMPRVISQADAIRKGRTWCAACGHHVDRSVTADGEVVDKCKCPSRRVA